MSFEPEFLAHEQLTTVKTAMSAELGGDSGFISVSMIGRRILLEGMSLITAIAKRRSPSRP
ncbi:hypothetical protein [Rhizobium sp. AN80A]|uniref:hypothetical protein n=1 Tax=Rhizobium sp. AN80A TaxID=3040673 RepID=UPI0024B3347C|nr:hypothetical protein [Rhizobium sp. AN80A]